MGYKYDFYRTPRPKNSNRKETFHARVVPSGTIDLRGMAELIHKASSATVGDVMMVVELLVDQIQLQLSNGRRVVIPRLGVFELTLANKPVESPKEIRSESIRVKSVVLRPDKEMKLAMKQFKAVRSDVKRHSKSVSDEEMDELLLDFFEKNEFITARNFRELCGFTESTGTRRLRKLIEAGKLKATGYKHSPLYWKGDNLGNVKS